MLILSEIKIYIISNIIMINAAGVNIYHRIYK